MSAYSFERRLAAVLAADIVSYTRMMGADEEGTFRLVQKLKLTIIDPLASAHNGRVFKTMGDGFFVEFASAIGAAEAALAIRNKVHEKLPSVHLRIGVALGDVIVDGDDLFGDAINLAARLQQSAQSDEIRVSDDIIRFIDGKNKASWTSLGRLEFKNIQEPQLAFRLCDPNETEGVKRTKSKLTQAQPRRKPPAIRQSFVGRDKTLAELQGILGQPDQRLVTITGPGGVGKTTLALRLAHILEPSFPDGTHFVNLGTIDKPSLFWTAIAQPLKIQESDGRTLEDAVISELKRCSMLLVLDNMEHLLETATEVAAILDQADGLVVLITSRQRLELLGEQEYALPPLSLPSGGIPGQEAEQRVSKIVASSEALQLFQDRATASNPRFEIDERNINDVVRLCKELDGLPLAIELAAARAKLLTPSAICRRLSAGLGLLKDGRRDIHKRHRTLEAAMNWSFDLLDEAEQKLLCQLSVFASSFDVDAVEAACVDVSQELDIFDGLSSLVDKSLLQTQSQGNGEPRFSMLQTVRTFAAQRLACKNESVPTRWLAANYFLAKVERAAWDFRRQDQDYATDLIDLDYGNILGILESLAAAPVGEHFAELRFCAALWPYWERRGYFEDGEQRLNSALARASAAPANFRAEALSGVGTMLWHRGQYELSADHHSQALKLYHELNDSLGIAFASNNLGVQYLERRDFNQAKALFEQCFTIAKATDQHLLAIYATHNLGEIHFTAGEYEDADRYYEESLNHSRATKDSWLIAIHLGMRGMVHTETGHLDQAYNELRESLVLLRDLADPERISECLQNMACLADKRADYAMLVQCLAAADKLRRCPRRPVDQIRYEKLTDKACEVMGRDRCLEVRDIIASVTTEAILQATLEGSLIQSRPKVNNQ